MLTTKARIDNSAASASATIMEESLCPEYELLVPNTPYQLTHRIGSGGYGVVFGAKHTMTGATVAIKKLGQVRSNPILGRRALREIRLLRHFRDHENIISVEEVLRPSSTDFDEIFIVQEYMQSDLGRILHSSQPLSEDHFQYFLWQILRGLKYIHSANVLHRDLKPQNILINEDCLVKICDFGLARGMDEQSPFMTEYVATRWYRAPEIMFSFDTYTKAVDVWSVGCIFAEMFFRKPFFPGVDYVNQLKLILAMMGTPSKEYFERVGNQMVRKFLEGLPHVKKTPLQSMFPKASPLALDLLDRMLDWNPETRITIEEALAHPFLATYHDVADEPSCVPFNYAFEIEAENEARLQELLFNEVFQTQTQTLLYNPPQTNSTHNSFNPLSLDDETLRTIQQQQDPSSFDLVTAKPGMYVDQLTAIPTGSGASSKFFPSPNAASNNNSNTNSLRSWGGMDIGDLMSFPTSNDNHSGGGNSFNSSTNFELPTNAINMMDFEVNNFLQSSNFLQESFEQQLEFGMPISNTASNNNSDSFFVPSDNTNFAAMHQPQHRHHPLQPQQLQFQHQQQHYEQQLQQQQPSVDNNGYGALYFST